MIDLLNTILEYNEEIENYHKCNIPLFCCTPEDIQTWLDANDIGKYIWDKTILERSAHLWNKVIKDWMPHSEILFENKKPTIKRKKIIRRS